MKTPQCGRGLSSCKIKIGTHCVHVGRAVHALWTCLFTDQRTLTHAPTHVPTHSPSHSRSLARSLNHSYIPNDIVGRVLYSALPRTIRGLLEGKYMVDQFMGTCGVDSK